MEKNINWLDRLMRSILAAILFFAVIVLFKHPVARILGAAGALFALWEAFSAKCYLTGHLGSKNITERLNEGSLYLLGLVVIQMTLAYEWWSAGWEKVSSPEFVSGINGTLGYFASKNPFPWYKDFLLGFATRNSTLFAYSVEWSQIAIAIILAIAGAVFVYSKQEVIKKNALKLSILALIGGILMNANFYLAAGWTGPGTHGINVVMFWVQGILAYIWLHRVNQENQINS